MTCDLQLPTLFNRSAPAAAAAAASENEYVRVHVQGLLCDCFLFLFFGFNFPSFLLLHIFCIVLDGAGCKLRKIIVACGWEGRGEEGRVGVVRGSAAAKLRGAAVAGGAGENSERRVLDCECKMQPVVGIAA